MKKRRVGYWLAAGGLLAVIVVILIVGVLDSEDVRLGPGPRICYDDRDCKGMGMQFACSEVLYYCPGPGAYCTRGGIEGRNEGGSCTNDFNGNPGICRNGICAPLGCTSELDCSQSQDVCKKRACVQSSCTFVYNDGAPCGQNKVCKQGSCLNLCDDNNECPPKECQTTPSCLGGLCYYTNSPTGAPCTTSDGRAGTCSSFGYCRESFIQTNPKPLQKFLAKFQIER